MSVDEIEAQIRLDTTWQRPSWPLGQWGTDERMIRSRLYNAFGLGADDGAPLGSGKQSGSSRQPISPEEEALAVLDLSAPVDFPAIKARYRELAKKHHPDANGGDRVAEEKLKVINQAYSTLKARFHSETAASGESAGG